PPFPTRRSSDLLWVDAVVEHRGAAGPAANGGARGGNPASRHADHLTVRIRPDAAVFGDPDRPSARGWCPRHGDVAPEADQDTAGAGGGKRGPGGKVGGQRLPR